MQDKKYRLKPFGIPILTDKFEIEAGLKENELELILTYRIIGKIEQLMISPNRSHLRKGNLWLHTCFELFLKKDSSPEYFEVNISPAGDFNIYHFDSYRTGMREVKEVLDIPVTLKKTQRVFDLSATLNLGKLGMTGTDLQQIGVNLAVVLEDINGQKTYWSVKHAAEEPDFHNPKSFIL